MVKHFAKLLMVVLALLLAACSGISITLTAADSQTVAQPTATQAAATKRPSATSKPTLAAVSINCDRTLTGGAAPNIPKLSLKDLYKCRPETRDTLQAIQSDGPFQYRQDDTVFSNFEGILPKASKGTYHEYTVITPDASTRGTRRIITSGSLNRRASAFDKIYYTDDHYKTIWLVTGL